MTARDKSRSVKVDWPPTGSRPTAGPGCPPIETGNQGNQGDQRRTGVRRADAPPGPVRRNHAAAVGAGC